MKGLKWTRRTTRKIAQELRRGKIQVGAGTVRRWLKQMGYSLRVNHKRLASGHKNPPPRQVRNRQFLYINRKRKEFSSAGQPIISVDAKKKELVGKFKNAGVTWQREPHRIKDHDFRSDAQGMAISYGLYDPETNRGLVLVGTSTETPSFAVDAVVSWWKSHGDRQYPDADELLIRADCGGGNSAGARGWKYHLQHRLCNPFGLKVTVCHYPPGASKGNPIEHRLFSEISKNWAVKPLESYQTVVNYIRSTTTTTGLKVGALLSAKRYEKGEEIAPAEMQRLALAGHKTLPNWNYTLTPSQM